MCCTIIVNRRVCLRKKHDLVSVKLGIRNSFNIELIISHLDNWKLIFCFENEIIIDVQHLMVINLNLHDDYESVPQIITYFLMYKYWGILPKTPPRISHGFNLNGHNDMYTVKDVWHWRAKEHLSPAAVVLPYFALRLISFTTERLLEYREAIGEV